MIVVHRAVVDKKHTLPRKIPVTADWRFLAFKSQSLLDLPT